MAQPGSTPWSEPPRLPGPGALTHYTLESPILPALTVLLGSLLGAWMLHRAGRARVGLWIASAGIALAGGLLALGGMVETAREIVIDRTLTLARTIGQGNQGFASEALAPTLYLRMGRSAAPVGSDDRALVLRAVSLFPGRVTLEAFAVPDGHASADSANSARTRLRVRTGGSMGPSLSWWQLDWRRDPDGEWRVYTIELLLFNGQAPPPSIGEEARRVVP